MLIPRSDSFMQADPRLAYTDYTPNGPWSDGQVVVRNFDGVGFTYSASLNTLTVIPNESHSTKNANNFIIQNLPVPSVGSDVANKTYVDSHSGSGGIIDAPSDGTYYGRVNAAWNHVVPLAGGTMLGPLILSVDPTAILGAATKGYVDSHSGAGGIPDAPSDSFLYGRINATWNRAVPLAGGTMTGPLILSSDPTMLSGAATKNYVDTHVGGGGGIPDAPSDSTTYGRMNAAWSHVLALTGGTLTGPLTLAADPSIALGAATKQYVDSHIGGGGSTALLVTRAQIPTTTMPSTTVLSGFYNPGDLGAGAVYSSVGATSGGTMAIQDATGTWFNLVTGATANLGWFGAKGDNAADDTAAFTAAFSWLNVLPAAGYPPIMRNLLLPAGSFQKFGTHTIIRSGASITGIGGRSNARIKQMDGNTCFAIDSTNNVSEVDFRNFSIYATSGMCLECTNVYFLSIHNVFFSCVNGIHIIGCGTAHISDIVIIENLNYTNLSTTGIGGYLFTVENYNVGGVGQNYSNSITLTNSIFSSAGSISALKIIAGLRIIAVDGFYISNCYIGGGFYYCDVTFEPTTGISGGQYISTVKFNNVYFDGTGPAGQQGCAFDSPNTGTAITLCSWTGCIFANCAYNGMWVNFPIQNCVVTGCSFYGNGQAGMHINNTSVNNLVIVGNNFSLNTGSNLVGIGLAVSTVIVDLNNPGLTDAVTVANLPSPSGSNKGMRKHVSDATSTTFWSIPSGGGSIFAPVMSDGGAWHIG